MIQLTLYLIPSIQTCTCQYFFKFYHFYQKPRGHNFQLQIDDFLYENGLNPFCKILIRVVSSIDAKNRQPLFGRSTRIAWYFKENGATIACKDFRRHTTIFFKCSFLHKIKKNNFRTKSLKIGLVSRGSFMHREGIKHSRTSINSHSHNIAKSSFVINSY